MVLKKLPRPKEIIRLTLADEIPAIAAIYVIAYLKSVVYVGKSESSVGHRLATHKVNALKPSEQLGRWMIFNSDWANIRVDLLIPPDNVDMRSWEVAVEAALVQQLQPLLNQQLQKQFNKEMGICQL